MPPARNVEVVLGERFHHSPEALTAQSLQGTEALAALVAPAPVAPVLYKRKGGE
jgi:hypothetical protein